MGDRAQLSLTLVEAAIGAVLVLSVAALVVFAAGGSGPSGEHARLDRYATDLGQVLVDPSGGAPTLKTLVGSARSFDRVETAIRREAAATLPSGVFYRIETRYGSLGHPVPATEIVGTTTIQTVNGTVRIWVWTP